MKGYLLIALVAVSLLFITGVFYAGYRSKKCPEPIPVDTHREDSLKVVAAQWEGQARAYRIEREELKRLLSIYKKSIPPVSERLKKNTDAIRTAGINAAIDTLNLPPVGR